MTANWFIDALDARAGIAFASCRSADLLADDQDFERPAVRIAAPDFTPSTLSGRALGFAAARAAFQEGFFVDENEVGFPSLDVLVEFVRRTYVATGGGDGAGGGGTVPPPPDLPPDGETGPRFPLEGEDIDIVFGELGGELASFFASAQQQSQGLALERAQDTVQAAQLVSVSEFHADMATISHGRLIKLAALAVAEIGCELVLRCPGPHPDARTVSVWWNSVSRLHLAAGRLALWPMVAELADVGKFANAGALLVNRGIQWRFDFHGDGVIHHLEQQRSPDAYALIAALTLSLEGLHHVAWNPPVDRHDFQRVLAEINYYRDDGQTDRFEDLTSWPLPASVADRVALGARASVADYLALATSAPASIGTPTPVELGVLLFASMHLTAKLGKYRSWSGEQALLAARQDESARCALDWLGRQMPELIFPAVIESIIGQSTRLRYV